MHFQIDEKRFIEKTESPKGFVSLVEWWKDKDGNYKPNWVTKKIYGQDKVVPASIGLGSDKATIAAFGKWLASDMETETPKDDIPF